jgi:hypothetical protein
MTGLGPVNSIPPIKGRYITRSLKTRNEAAFAAADSRPKEARSVPAPQAGIDDVGFIGVIRDIISQIGVDRFLRIAAAVEAQAHH